MMITTLAAIVLAAAPSPTPIGDAVVVCDEQSFGNVDASGTNGYFVLDDGHSVAIQETAFVDVAPMRVVAPRFDCLAGELGFPAWLPVLMAMPSASNPITIGEYTIAWSLGPDGTSQFLVYDRSAAVVPGE
jgi:hypothetical protein